MGFLSVLDFRMGNQEWRENVNTMGFRFQACLISLSLSLNSLTLCLSLSLFLSHTHTHTLLSHSHTHFISLSLTHFTSFMFFFVYSLAVIQDILVFIPLAIYLLKAGSIVSIEPQMRHVHHVLTKIAIQPYRWLVQLEMKIDPENNSDLNAIQFLSGACRAAKHPLARNLPASHLLRSMTDSDEYDFRKRKSTGIKLTFVLLLMLPIVYLLSGEFVGLFIDFTVPLVWTGYTIANSFILVKSQWYMVGIYLFVGAFLVWHMRIIYNIFKWLRAIGISIFSFFTPSYPIK